jgi:hypothetical protein
MTRFTSEHCSPRRSSDSGKHLVLGAVHEAFIRLSEEDPVFWRNLFGLLKVAFRKRTRVECENLNFLKVVLTTNLSPKLTGDERDVPESELTDGMSHFLELVRMCKPRVVVALTRRVYKVLTAGSGPVIEVEERHELKNQGKGYKPRSCWVDVAGVGRVLFARLPQHPSKAGFFGGRYVSSVGAYLGRRFRDALRGPEAETEPVLPEACSTTTA